MFLRENDSFLLKHT